MKEGENYMYLSPVLISVYDRKSHLEKCINSLRQNELAKETIIYIVSDNYHTWEYKAKIEEVRDYVKSITGFKEVRFIFNEKNLGAFLSVRNAIEIVLKEHGKVIFLEDDIEVSCFFLKYMNDGLEMFKEEKKIFSICAYTPSDLKIPKSYSKDIYIWSRNSPWGFATWRDRWDDLDLELNEYQSFLKDNERVRKFKYIAPMSMSVLKADRKGKIKAMDVRISFNMFMKDLYSIYPVKSLVRNNGFDNSGLHCGYNKKFMNEVIYQKEINLEKEVEPDIRIYKARHRWHSSIKRDYILPIIEKMPMLYNVLTKMKDKIKNKNLEHDLLE